MATKLKNDIIKAGAGGGGESQPGAGENPLAFLREHEMFNQIRTVIQQNPNMLPAMLQQIGQSNPQLLHIISQVKYCGPCFDKLILHQKYSCSKQLEPVALIIF